MRAINRRLSRIENHLQAQDAQAGTSPVVWVLLTVIGFHLGGWRSGGDRHVLTHGAEVLGIRPDADPAEIEIQFGLVLRELGIDGVDPAPEAVAAMQRLLDEVPVEARDSDVAWWPGSAIEMWDGR